MKKRISQCMPSIALANERTDGAPLSFRIRMPYGDYPYGSIKCPDGKTRECVQVWDRNAAQRVSDIFPNEGIPFYQGHPDIAELAAKYPDKSALGWSTSLEVADDAAYLIGTWNEADPGKGFKFFSPAFQGFPLPKNATTCVLEIIGIQSVGLVNRPNIKEFCLPNEEAEDNPNEGVLMDLKKLAVSLGLPETATLAEIEAKVDANNAELIALKAKSDTAATELANAQQDAEKAKTTCANERKARIGTILDHAIAEGRIPPSGRGGWEKQLTEDFDKALVVLGNEKPAVKTKTVFAPKDDAAQFKANCDIQTCANELMAKNPTWTRDEAWAKAKEQVAAKPEQK